MLLDTLGASLLRNILAGKGVMRAGEGTVRVGYGTKRSSLKNFDEYSDIGIHWIALSVNTKTVT